MRHTLCSLFHISDTAAHKRDLAQGGPSCEGRLTVSCPLGIMVTILALCPVQRCLQYGHTFSILQVTDGGPGNEANDGGSL